MSHLPDSCSLELVSVHFQEQTYPNLYRLVSAGKVLILGPQVDGIASGLSHVGLEPGHMFASRSTVETVFGMFFTSGSCVHVSCLVLRETVLALGPWSVGLYLRQRSN